MAKAKSKKSKKRSNASTQTAQVSAKAASTSKPKEAAAKASKADKNAATTKVEKTEKSKTSTKKDSTKKPNIFMRLMQYFQDVKSELKRVTWPTKEEVLNSSLVVIGALVFFGILIFAVDSVVVPLLDAYSKVIG